MKWKLEKLGDICTISSGGTPSRNNSTYFKGTIPWAKISDIENANGYISNTEEKITIDALKSINNRIFPPNTLLLAIYGSVGKVAITMVEMSTNQAILGIRPVSNSKIDLQYLKHYFSTIKERLLDKAVGGTLQNISLGIVKQLQIPLPPLPTQQKIAAILDEADALRRKDKALLAKYDELLQAVFYDMFGDPVKNEKGWEVRKFGSVLLDIVAGSSYGGEERALTTDELGVLKISAVTSGEFKSSEYKAIPKSSITKTIVTPRKNDLLFSRANTRELVGAMCIVDKDYPTLFLPDKLWRLDLETTQCNSFYIKNLLAVPDLKCSLTKTATGTSGSMLNISMSKLRDLKIPLPPVDLQNTFSIIAQNIQTQKSQIIQQQTYSENLFQSLMQRAFKGELLG